MAKQKNKTSGSPLRNKNKSMLILFLTPATLLYLIVFLYPSVRTVVMSFFKVEGVTDPVSSWQFNAGRNYVDAFNDTLFQSAMTNLGKLWLIGGVAVMPLNYMYELVFGSSNAAQAVRNSGIGAAIGVMMAAIVVLVFGLTNFIVKNDDVEL